MLTALTSAARGPAAISRTKRTMHVLLCAIPTTFMLLVGVLTVYNMSPGVMSARPRIDSVSAGEAADRAGIEVGDVIVAVDGEPMLFRSQLRNKIATHPDQPITLSILRGGQPLVIHATPARSADEGLLGIGITGETPERSPSLTWRYLWLQTVAGLIIAGIVGLCSTLVVRGGIALRLMSIAVVTRNGTLASESKALLRAVLSWLPVLAVSAAACAGHEPILTLTPQATLLFFISPMGLPVFFSSNPSIFFIRVAVITMALGVFGLGVIAAVLTPERGLQDRLAGTWLVPR